MINETLHKNFTETLALTKQNFLENQPSLVILKLYSCLSISIAFEVFLFCT